MNQSRCIRKELSHFLKSTRQEKAYTLEDMEIMTGIPQETQLEWENGINFPRGPQFLRWIAVFDEERRLEASLLICHLKK